VFERYGENAPIEGGVDEPESQYFKVVFDIADRNDTGGLNRQFNSVARFINMHVRAGVPRDNIEVAMVIHGNASFDLTNDRAYSEKFDNANDNTDLINLLAKSGVKIFICGQSSSYHEIDKAQLNQNVKMSPLPINHADKIKAKIMLIHGDEDIRVPSYHSKKNEKP